jgi:hypothetical protein
MQFRICHKVRNAILLTFDLYFPIIISTGASIYLSHSKHSQKLYGERNDNDIDNMKRKKEMKLFVSDFEK